jgi:hypothetical protein
VLNELEISLKSGVGLCPTLLQILKAPQVEMVLLGKLALGHPGALSGTPNGASGDTPSQLIICQRLAVWITFGRTSNLSIGDLIEPFALPEAGFERLPLGVFKGSAMGRHRISFLYGS